MVWPADPQQQLCCGGAAWSAAWSAAGRPTRQGCSGHQCIDRPDTDHQAIVLHRRRPVTVLYGRVHRMVHTQYSHGTQNGTQYTVQCTVTVHRTVLSTVTVHRTVHSTLYSVQSRYTERYSVQSRYTERYTVGTQDGEPRYQMAGCGTVRQGTVQYSSMHYGTVPQATILYGRCNGKWYGMVQ